eukprot:scaffold34291_cov70-Phaeocystis_antarctica.AAC.2
MCPLVSPMRNTLWRYPPCGATDSNTQGATDFLPSSCLTLINHPLSSQLAFPHRSSPHNNSQPSPLLPSTVRITCFLATGLPLLCSQRSPPDHR